MTTSSDLSRFDAIDLDSLIAEASLQTRVDRKYVLTRDSARQVVARFDDATRILDTEGIRSFRYESVYFDTPDLLSFRMAAQPRRRRFKLRTRTYLDSQAAFLELKTRGARSATVKERVEYAAGERTVLSDLARSYAAEGLHAVGIAEERADDLGSRLTTTYRRATFVAPDGSARCTLDTELRWVDVEGTTLLTPRLLVIETKSGSAASAFDRALWRAGHRPVNISKYATGLAALHPDLPRNRWARLLRGPFADAIRHHPNRQKETPCATAA
ncbi:polyphosphate polymerase domain-containing protein [Microbacterium invictum]|uniref:Polyphosphate polymerase domain-containing protein n=1 Tax=Microbacterium invictum TaxID=515415 RepID=A0ABZ0VG76_9MICO|nr:polyphosphate polymerase domain-containing protein [Microbacterium invictum]WQB71190.1 polyphosphate polymerase domain-containing protein [Microbacterium invictum]